MIDNLRRGLFRENPIFVLMLGLCPMLAVTSQVINGIGMGVATIAVLVASNLVISLIRNLVPSEIRIPIFIVVVASFVTIVDLFLQAYIPALAESLGIFIPLIVVNCIILGRAEAFASRNKPLVSIFDGVGMGLGFLLALVLLAAVREILGNGTLTIEMMGVGTTIRIPLLEEHKAIVMVLPPGAFLTLGLLMGFFNAIKKKPNPNTNTYTLTDNHIARRRVG